ncbi:MAG TPA: hypothetical protein DCF44_12055 [Chitinophagaceae bacterium]|nr:hypothetical protein [Chitinophagaceae bacterium]
MDDLEWTGDMPEIFPNLGNESVHIRLKLQVAWIVDTFHRMRSWCDPILQPKVEPNGRLDRSEIRQIQ